MESKKNSKKKDQHVPVVESTDRDLKDAHLYINREFSHLEFNFRVLAQAKNMAAPLLERLKFLLIFANNLDEFFEIRVAGVKKQMEYGHTSMGPDGLHPKEVLRVINERCRQAIQEEYQLLYDDLLPELAKQGLRFLRRSEWTSAQTDWVKHYFRTQVLPVISPIGLDPSHPFPSVANKTLHFIVALAGSDAFGRQSGLAIVPAPRSLPRVIQLPASLSDADPLVANFIFLSSMIHAHAADLFPGMHVKGCYQFRLTRNADLNLNEDLMQDMAMALKGELISRRFGDEVRLEVADTCPDELAEFLLNQFDLSADALFRIPGIVNLSRMMSITQMDFPALKYPSFAPALPDYMKSDSNIFELLKQRDIFLYHPYQSFQPVIDLLRQAARDPQVLAIKQTLYRTGNHSEVMSLLVDAARNGKEVTAVIELRARFDEESNIEGAARLQQAGATVVYGVVGHKTHAKMIMVVRREGEELKRYLHLGTGNYHVANARLYTDYSLLTQDESLANDVHQIFQQLTGLGSAAQLTDILHAPFTLQSSLLALIQHEIEQANTGKPARIMIKVNGLTEKKIIQALYRASQAGVKIELIVRGACALRPEVPGISDNIRVISIVGRFLEHARVYYFYAAGAEKVYCSSADWMERNLLKRVEVCFPIKNPELKQRVIHESLLSCLVPCVESWRLHSDGSYKPCDIANGHSAHEALLDTINE
jgi:polyphosphate kinase